MEFIGKNELVINAFSKELTILDGLLEKVSIYEVDYVLYIDVYIKLAHSKGKTCMLKFIDVQEYSFYHKSNYSFGNIEVYKFLKNGDLYYISLDPYDDSLNCDEKDQDFIFSRTIEGYLQNGSSSGS
jgi:hypothetical protein